MKKIAILFTLFTINIFAQKQSDYTFGKVTNEELNLTKYDKDTTANALVLFDYGNTTFKVKNNRIIIQTKFYKKIKIFNAEGYKYGTEKIPIYNNKSENEEVLSIKAETHNGSTISHLLKGNIYRKKINENWSEVSFTLPNLKKGSVIEYEYTLESPFKFNLTGWYFQSSIPSKVSLYKALIPGNYVYNRKLNGYLKLTKNLASVKKKCFHVPPYMGDSDCEKLTYEMRDIPAFEKEDYMTNEDNFISKIKFELSELRWFDGSNIKYTSTWGAVDKEFKHDRDIGGQFKKTKFFKDKLPKKISSLNSDLEKAKAIYTFIQNHYTWNKKYSIFKGSNVKKAFEIKIGSVGEINISLINALKSAGLNAELVLLSTRENGFPTKIHPVITDFNYIIAKVNINDTYYLLDATDKLIPFGILPFRCLNGSGRVMDFKNPSYWMDIKPNNTSKTQLNVSLKLDNEGNITGKLRKVYFGYDAIDKRKDLLTKTEDDVLSNFESSFDNLEVLDYKLLNQKDIDKPIVENYDIAIDSDSNLQTIFLHPFFDIVVKKNPFKQENRLYPVDYGYPKKAVVNFSLELPENFKIKSLPKSVAYKLQKNGGSFNLITKNHDNKRVTLNSTFSINKPIFYNYEYYSLKELYKLIINTEKTPIVISSSKSNITSTN
ncbi:MAG: hypothetical protein R3342_00485 [Lutibacter sp.]|uniref:transglutaminase domain-containing protein n=1 Tax=Lutibacter sp. TaxID=1925666 RepID=UPI00299F391D|nr:hypothetical protein [Lutibacter sp.]MDX1827996.1 hypothetical protein [Lutibacter sp.]